MRIEILKNRETSLVIDDIGMVIEEDGILKEGYKQAVQTLARYVKQTSKIWMQLKCTKSTDSQINDILYQSPHNIIAFSGKRGTGKTSAMISFSEFLKRHGEDTDQSKKIWKDNFNCLNTLVLSPIDPTMLENDQNILDVVLSRLVFKAEERWNNNPGFCPGTQNLEKDKNELLKKASACLSGIHAVKHNSEIETLAKLQRVGDSAVLKKNLFDLVNMVLEFCLGKDNSCSGKSILVIPIDDTDCQILKAHDVMEDIRRYLTLPNVVILMATDEEMLRYVFEQHYAKAFQTAMKKELVDIDYVGHYADKYLSKLIPVANRVYLPLFEEISQANSVSLELGFYEDDHKGKDLISKSSRDERDTKRRNGISHDDIDFNFQAKVLTYIYKRTGLVFFEHSNYINNIIPTTMRGLAHLLTFLNSMEEVEEIDYSHNYTANEFKALISRRLKCLEKNLDSFEKFFMNEWVPAKLSVEMKMPELMRGIVEQVPTNLVNYVEDELNWKYRKVFYGNHYYGLLDAMADYNGTFKSLINKGTIEYRFDSSKKEVFTSKIDYYNTFAIKTLISIINNKAALRIKQKSLESAINEKNGSSHFEMRYTLNQLENLIPDSTDMQPTIDEQVYLAGLKPIIDQYRRLLLHRYKQQSDMDLYCMQELAWIVLCNWDAQEVICKSIDDYLKDDKIKRKSSKVMWSSIQSGLAEKNCKMLEKIVHRASVQNQNLSDAIKMICKANSFASIAEVVFDKQENDNKPRKTDIFNWESIIKAAESVEQQVEAEHKQTNDVQDNGKE